MAPQATVTGWEVTIHFSATHAIGSLPGWHPEALMHGHNWTVELELARPGGDVTEQALLREQEESSAIEAWAAATLDHKHLNEVLTDQIPSPERLAMWIYQQLAGQHPELVAVRVRQSPDTSATYRPS